MYVESTFHISRPVTFSLVLPFLLPQPSRRSTKRWRLHCQPIQLFVDNGRDHELNFVMENYTCPLFFPFTFTTFREESRPVHIIRAHRRSAESRPLLFLQHLYWISSFQISFYDIFSALMNFFSRTSLPLSAAAVEEFATPQPTLSISHIPLKLNYINMVPARALGSSLGPWFCRHHAATAPPPGSPASDRRHSAWAWPHELSP